MIEKAVAEEGGIFPLAGDTSPPLYTTDWLGHLRSVAGPSRDQEGCRVWWGTIGPLDLHLKLRKA